MLPQREQRIKLRHDKLFNSSLSPIEVETLTDFSWYLGLVSLRCALCLHWTVRGIARSQSAANTGGELTRGQALF